MILCRNLDYYDPTVTEIKLNDGPSQNFNQLLRNLDTMCRFVEVSLKNFE